MLPQNKPDRIRILFDDHRLVANAGLLLPATLARHLGLRKNSSTITLSSAERRRRANTGDIDADAGRFRAGRRRLHRRRRCAARWWDGRCSRLRGQGAIHPGDLPAQLPVGACPSTRPREPPVVGPGLGRWGRTPILAPEDHRPGLDHLQGLWTGQGGSAPPRLYTGARGYHPLLAIAAGTGRGADVPAARGPGQHRPWRRPLPAWRRWSGCATAGPGTTHGALPTAASRPTLSLPPAVANG